MLSRWLHTGPEKAELQELNARLCDYVCRVRELERENLLLEEELRGRRGQRGPGAEGQARRAEEARRLRQQLDELSWATALAEGERDALRRELRELQLLGEEARAARGLLDAELGAQRRELQEALGARAALEALLGRLQAERRGLDAAHEREVRALRARTAGLTPRHRARAAGPAAPSPHLRQAHDRYALLVAESWRETLQLYEDEVRELEAALRRGEESRRRAEEETRLCAQEAEALRRRALELEQLRALLEDELLRMREAYELQAQERQSAITCLEDEKAALTLAMADRLRDYQELVHVKTSLSLEVATYRALLEGESNPEILILTERIENLPQEFRNTSYQYTDSALRRENERNLFSRQKAPSGSLYRGQAPRPNVWAPRTPQTGVGGAAGRGLLGAPRPPFAATARREIADEKTAQSHPSLTTSPPVPGLLRNTEVQAHTLPGRPRTGGTKDARAGVAGESTLGGDTWAHERTAMWGEKMFDSKEKASEERNLRWEALTKLDKEARERGRQQDGVAADGEGPSGQRSAGQRQIPVRVEAPQSSRPEGAPTGVQTPPEKDAGAGPARRLQRREARFRLGAGDTGDPMTESIAENIVSGILQQFTQSADVDAPADSFPDTKVTYVSRKELPDDRKTTTEIVVESRLTEDFDVSDAAGLDQLLSEDVRDEAQRTGKATEQVVRDVIQLGLKGREGRARVVSVEVIEEPLSCVGGERADESPTPFRVEEAEDAEDAEGPAEGAGYAPTEVASSRLGEPPPPPRGLGTHVEEVTEAGDSEGEQSYFVSTPEEGPEHDVGRDRDEGSVYGQIHIEEESTIRYSWQDEIVSGRRRRVRADDAWGETVVKPLDVPAPSLEGDAGPPWKEQAGSGEIHAGTTVIEKEIKIRPALHTAIRRGDGEPRQRLAEVIGQLEESLPERVREQLAAVTSEGRGGPGAVSVDVKKGQAAGGGEAVTLVAQVNLSETVDADRLDLEELSRDEAGEIEKAVEAVVRDSLAKRPGPAPGSPDSEAAVAAPAPGFGFKRWATQELYSPAGDDGADDGDGGRASRSTRRAPSQGPVSATVEVTSPRGFAQAHVLEDISQSGRHITVGPTGTWRTERGSPEGRTAQVLEVDVSHTEATPSWTREATALFPAGTEAEAHGVSDSGTWRDAGSRGDPAASMSVQSKAQAEFDKTVQLQRMVDQRSVVSDEKKVAVLYLDNQGEDEEGDWF
ncbi:synemin isoform X2 [Pteropus medius]|uniref:synemin isoform X2 n=1 Tax=Pteropus vampyrus TaxID=132908 RepID=UPI00196A7001|nr:synemin isoform X2 [Pteropus giganteus]